MRLKIGNDELILHIRKKNVPNNATENDQLGKTIWQWLRDNDTTAKITLEDQPCYWGDTGNFVSPTRLPKTAAQFEIDANILPALYRFLQTL